MLFLKKLSDVSFIFPPFSGSTPVLLINGIELKHILLAHPISKYSQFSNFCIADKIKDIRLYKILLQSMLIIVSQKLGNFSVEFLLISKIFFF